MAVWIYPVYMLLYLGLLVYGAGRVFPRARHLSAILILLVTFGLFYNKG